MNKFQILSEGVRPWAADLPADARRFLEDLDGVAATANVEYLTALESGWVRPGRISIQDGVWGFIELSAGEVALVDSPFVQRLRRVRQLGLAHLLYPFAGYSRLEHSLGVCHVARLYTDHLRWAAEEAGQSGPTREDCQLLRYASLLHDIGHIAFSHAGERCWRFFPEADTAIGAIRGALAREWGAGKSPPNASDALAVCLVGTPVMGQILRHATGLDRIDMDVVALQRGIGKLILGAPDRPGNEYLGEILSSPIDADKLDYIARDSMVSSVSMAGDVRRLVTKTELRRATTSGGRIERRLSLSVTGATALADMAMSRALLRQRLYRHPKVLAAESMLENALEIAAGLDPGAFAARRFFELEDERLLQELAELAASARLAETDESLAESPAARLLALVGALRGRRLLKRAAALGADQVEVVGGGDAYVSLQAALGTEESRQRLRQLIAAEVRELLATDGCWDGGPVGDEQFSVASVRVSHEATRPSWGAAEQGEVLPYGAATPLLEQRRQLLDALEAERPSAWIFAPEPLRSYANAAASRVLARHFGIRLNAKAALQAKVDPTESARIAALAGSEATFV